MRIDVVDALEHDYDAGWVLKLYNGDDKVGTIALFWDAKKKTLKPDGLEVIQSVRGNNYGAVLAKFAVQTTNLNFVKKVTGSASTVFMNCVNPLSAGISVKELVLRLHSEDAVDEDAKVLGEQSVKNLKEMEEEKLERKKEEEKGYDIDRFPGFWGRVVYLARQKGVTFSSSMFGSGNTFDSGSIVNETITTKVLLVCVKAGIKGRPKGFVLNISAPIND